MIEEHVHCAECGREIATAIKISGGKTKPAELDTAKQLAPAMTERGPALVERIVPICPACAERVREANRIRSSSLLEVPSPRELLGI